MGVRGRGARAAGALGCAVLLLCCAGTASVEQREIPGDDAGEGAWEGLWAWLGGGRERGDLQRLPTGNARSLADVITAARRGEGGAASASAGGALPGAGSLGEGGGEGRDGAAAAREAVDKLALQAAISSAARSAPVLSSAWSTAEGRSVFHTGGVGDEGDEGERYLMVPPSALSTGGGSARGRALHPGGGVGVGSPTVRSAATCQLPAEESATAWTGQNFVLQGQRVSGTPDVIVAEMADTLSVLRQEFKDTYGYIWYTPTIGKLGIQFRRLSMLTGKTAWVSGTGGVGFADGGRESASFSLDITGVVMHPTCLPNEVTSQQSGGSIKCPAGARDGFAAQRRWVYVADSGNCAIRLVDSNTGAVRTKWGSGGCLGGTPAASDLVDSEYSDRVVLGGRLGLEWVGWRFLAVLDQDARRVRMFVPGQHQGLSALAGGAGDACDGSAVDTAGGSATFCRPVAIAATSDMRHAVVSEIVTASGTEATRLRLLSLSYQEDPVGGGVEGVSCVVTTLTGDAYASGAVPSFLWTSGGGVWMSPGATGSSGSVVAGSFSGREESISIGYGGSSSLYTLVSVLVATNEAKVLVDASGSPLTARTVVGVADHTDPGYVQLTVARHEHVPFTEADFTSLDITFQVPKTSFTTLKVLNSTFEQSCADAGLASARRALPAGGGGGAVARGEVGVVDEEDGRVRLVSLSLVEAALARAGVAV